MKELFNKFALTNEQTHEDFNLGSTILVILLFLSFIGTTFYLMVASF